LTALVGRNAAGKSNILRAISWVATTATAARQISPDAVGKQAVAIQIAIGPDIFDYEIDVEFDFPTERGSRELQIVESLRVRRDGDNPVHVFDRTGGKVTIVDGGTIEIPDGMPTMPALVSVLPPESGTVKQVRPLLEQLRTIRYYPLIPQADTQLRYPVIRQTEYRDWLSNRGDLGNLGIAVLMRILDMKLTNEVELREVEDLLGRNGLGIIGDIRVEDLAVRSGQEDEKFYYTAFRPWSPQHRAVRSFGFSDLSSGTQRLIGLVVSMIYDHSATMLLEHPEDGIHRALLRKVIGLLLTYSDRSQFILASHSSVVFDAVRPDSIRLVTMQDSTTKVRPLSEYESRIAAKYLEEEGNLSDFLETVEED
jgi:predicted ATPase